MKRKKHTNSCLVRLLGLLAGSGFILLCITFGLYFFTEKPVIYEQEAYTVKGIKDVEVIQQTKEDEEDYKDQRDESIERESVAVARMTPVILEDDTKQEESIQEIEEIEEIETDDSQMEHQETTVVSEENQGEETLEKEEKPLAFEEVTVYDAYVLQLDEEVLEQIEGTLENGQIDYAAIINKMFSSLSFAQQVKILNMILSKVQSVDVSEIWNMIRDGISKEDSVRLQQLVQEHFTLEELDELYSYYASIETVENE